MLPSTLPDRPALESRSEIAEQLARCRARQPRVQLPDIAAAAKAFDAELGDWPVLQWMRPLALFPQTGQSQLAMSRALAAEGRIPAMLKARLCWTTARHNRAWYALAQAERWLKALNEPVDELYESPADASATVTAVDAALRFAAKLTTAPQTLVDADIQALQAHFTDHETAEIVYVVGTANMFDRFTETLALPCEDVN